MSLSFWQDRSDENGRQRTEAPELVPVGVFHRIPQITLLQLIRADDDETADVLVQRVGNWNVDRENHGSEQ